MRSSPEADDVKQSGLGFLWMSDEQNSQELFWRGVPKAKTAFTFQMYQVIEAVREFCNTLSAQSVNYLALY